MWGTPTHRFIWSFFTWLHDVALMMMIKQVVAGKTSYPKYLNTWHLLLKAFCSKFLINTTQNHNLVSARFFKSDNKKLHCLIPNNRDCHVGLTSCLKLILRMSSMTKFQINQGSSPVSPPFRSPLAQCWPATAHLISIKTIRPVPGPVLNVWSYSILNACYFGSKVGKSEVGVENQDQWYYNAQYLDQN